VKQAAMSRIVPETRIFRPHFCRWHYGSSFSWFNV